MKVRTAQIYDIDDVEAPTCSVINTSKFGAVKCCKKTCDSARCKIARCN